MLFQLQEMKNTIRSRDQRVVELQVEADQLREQAARQNSVVLSLKKRIQVNIYYFIHYFWLLYYLEHLFLKNSAKFLSQELEERERNHYATQGRNEIVIQGLQRDVKYHEDKAREYEQKIRQLEHNITEEIQLKERARLNLQVLLFIHYTCNMLVHNICSL